MSREKKFIRLLAANTIILLLPVVITSIVMIFSYLSKLETEFEKLNSKTIEATNARVDMLVENVLSVYYHLADDADVQTFLRREFGSNRDRALLLSDIKEKITDSLVNKDGIAHVVIFSRINDVFVSNETAYSSSEYYERYFEESDYEYEAFLKVLEESRTIPAWVVTDDYLVYCTSVRGSDKGNFLAAVKKQKVLDILEEVCGSLDIGYAVVCRGEEILMSTGNFNMTAYEASLQQTNEEYLYQGCLIKMYSSRKIGGLKYVYTINDKSFGGNIEQMIRSLVLIVIGVIGISVFWALRKILSARDMYVMALEENTDLENRLSTQTEKLTHQRLINTLRGYDFLLAEKQPIHLQGSRKRVLILRFIQQEDLEQESLKQDDSIEKDIGETIKKYLEAKRIEYLLLFDREIGHICVLGYDIPEIINRVIENLHKAMLRKCGAGLYAGLSAEISDVKKISTAYEWAEVALRYCIACYEEGGLVRYEDIMELEEGKMYYPAEKEKQLIRSIRMGMREEAEACLNYIYKMNFEERRLSKGAVRQLLVKMMNTIYELIDMVYSGEAAKYDEFGRVSRNVLQADNMEYSFDMIRSIALSICDKCAVRKDGELREKIVAYINENFMNQDLSLEKMATDFEISYYHLSRLFNEYMQMNFTTYLTGVRLEHSRDLLCTTALKVEEVAVQSGFLQSGSFVRAFKKYYGITPGKYRDERAKDK